ncbi:GntR family transcriptional regulator [Arthrobacter halodurans]|uniref:GntR family transcriptional regulator n=1 Tax=Arthrobacter halodurans TaxID=516699 RepID=A0ABV4UPJ2_9MICC
MPARSPLEPLRQESTPEIIARKLRAAIGDGEFRPGEQLGEAELARQLGVSRGPLREAMQRLAQEGLLTSIRNRGLFVVQPTAEDVSDIYLARTAVERSACLKIIELEARHREVGEALLGIVDRMEALAAEGNATARNLTGLDIEFHETLVRLADSPRLSRMHRTLVTETRICLSALEDTGYSPGDRVAEHRAIARAMIDADVPLLHRLLARHMDGAVAQISATMSAARAGAGRETAAGKTPAGGRKTAAATAG